MSHNCNTAVVYCMDWRFSPPQANLDEVLLKNNIVDSSGFDRIIVGGAVKNLASAQEESDIAFTLRQLDIADKLHNVKKMVLINHTDCGAYGGSSKFSDSNAEHNFHYEELRKAAALVKMKYPNIAVECYLAHLQQKDHKWSTYLVRI